MTKVKGSNPSSLLLTLWFNQFSSFSHSTGFFCHTVFFKILEHARHLSTSGLLHLLFLLPKMFLSWVSACLATIISWSICENITLWVSSFLSAIFDYYTPTNQHSRFIVLHSTYHLPSCCVMYLCMVYLSVSEYKLHDAREFCLFYLLTYPLVASMGLETVGIINYCY